MANCNPNLAILSRTKKGERLMAQEVLRLVMGKAIFPSMR